MRNESILYTLQISHWFGRFGNNVLQIVRALFYYENEISLKDDDKAVLIYENHPNLNSDNKIELIEKEEVKRTEIIISNDFFFYKNEDFSPIENKQIFQKYKIGEKLIGKNRLFIHIRGGDIFRGNGGHPAYIQPPLYFYEKVMSMKNWEEIIIVSEDRLNPVIQELLKKDKIRFMCNSVIDDFNLLSQAENLVLSNSTFSFVVYFNNTNLKRLYIAENNFFPKGKWSEREKDEIEVTLISLPNYNEEWYNRDDQLKKMIFYTT